MAAPTKARHQYRWPGGASLALYVAMGIEEYEVGGTLVEDVLERPGGEQGPELTNAAWRDYGNRVGGFRLIERLTKYGIAPTVLLNTAAYDTAPDLIGAARVAGAEIVGHGTSNSYSVRGLNEEEERAHIRRVIDRISREEGHPPKGWSSPWLEHSPNSLRLLSEEGIRYTLDLRMDDQPLLLQGRPSGLLAVPYGLELNDSSTMIARRVDAHQFATMIIDEFDELLDASNENSLVMSLVVHTYISGVPFRLRALSRALAHMAHQGKHVWFTTAGQIADHHRRMTR